MQNPYDPNRRYPPSPYPPKSKANSAYRDGWDKGWEMVMERGHRYAFQHWIENGYWLETSPKHHGFEDGAKAAIKKQIQRIEGEKRLAAEQRAEIARAKQARRDAIR